MIMKCSSIVTNVSPWKMLIMGEAKHVLGQGVYGKSLYFLFNFAVNLKLLCKLKAAHNNNNKTMPAMIKLCTSH